MKKNYNEIFKDMIFWKLTMDYLMEEKVEEIIHKKMQSWTKKHLIKKKTEGYLGILSTIIIMDDNFGVSKEKAKEVVESIFIQNYVSDQNKELIYQQLEEQYKKKIENNNNYIKY